MPLAQLCNRHLVIPEVETGTRLAAGGAKNDYVADAAIPRQIPCFVQAMRAGELLKYAKTDYAIFHRVFFASDPKLGRNYRLKYQGSRYLYILDIYIDCETGQLWVADCGERTQGTLGA